MEQDSVALDWQRMVHDHCAAAGCKPYRRDLGHALLLVHDRRPLATHDLCIGNEPHDQLIAQCLGLVAQDVIIQQCTLQT